MKIYEAKLQHKKEVRQIWEECFSDGEPFLSFYFENVYEAKETLLLEAEGEIASSLQMIPYSLGIFGQKFLGGYISGAATKEKFRGRGYMAELLKQSFYHMKNQGMAFSFLIPQGESLFRFYQQFGYATAFDLAGKEVALPKEEEKGIGVFCSLGEEDLLFACYDKWQKTKEVAILKSKKQFGQMVLDHQLGQGTLFVAKREKEIIGLCFAILMGDAIAIKEMVAFEEAGEKALLYQVGQHFQTEKALLLGAKKGNKTPLAMARVLCPMEAISKIPPALRPQCIFSLQDEQMPENSGIYCFSKEGCSRLEETVTPDFSCTPGELAAFLLGYYEKFYEKKNPYMNMMLN